MILLPDSTAWIVLVLIAVVAQTFRNFAQRSIGKQTNIWAAVLVRFLYGFPFAALAVFGLMAGQGPLPPASAFVPAYWMWLGLASVAHVLATGWLLMTMSKRNFVIAVALSKTELIQIIVFAMLLLQQLPTLPVLFSILIVSIGLCALAAPEWRTIGRGNHMSTLLLGLASGAGFALAALGFREAGLILLDHHSLSLSPLYAGVLNLFMAQLIQTVVLGGWLMLADPGALVSIIKQWRSSLGAGFCGALASMAWFTAYVLRPAAEVRTLGMLEVVLSYIVSRRLLSERTTAREIAAIALICTGVVIAALF